MKRRTYVLTGDAHCGHLAGLTPPQWWIGEGSKTGQIQRELWGYFSKWAEQFKGVDGFIHNGDAIDGKGQASGGTELLTTDRRVQGRMAAQAFAMFGAKKYLMTYGTPYHTGKEEDWEQNVADILQCPIHGNHFFSPSGSNVVVHLKHKIGSSTIPHGRHTAVAKDKLWLDIWHEAQNWPKANMIVRSHVHYWNYCGGPGWTAMTLPALCGAASKYGSRQCSGVVDFGIVWFEIDEKGELRFDPRRNVETVRVMTTRPSITTM